MSPYTIATIERIEEEFNEPFVQVVKDFCYRKDYLGASLGRYDLPKLFGICNKTMAKILKYYRLEVPRGDIPTHLEDECWVKWGYTLQVYLRNRIHWMTLKEIGQELGCNKETVREYLKKYKIKHYVFRERRKTGEG
jgi:hypothetical protein